VHWQLSRVLALLLTLLAARTRTRVLPLLLKNTDIGRALGSRDPGEVTLGEEDQGLSLSLNPMAADRAARASTQTLSIGTTEPPKLVLPAPLLLDLQHVTAASPGSVKARRAIAESERASRSLLLALLAQQSLDYMRDTRLRRRLGHYHGRGQGRSPGQDQGQCSIASEGETAVGVEAQQVNLF
jgi:hypothetical protein